MRTIAIPEVSRIEVRDGSVFYVAGSVVQTRARIDGRHREKGKVVTQLLRVNPVTRQFTGNTLQFVGGHRLMISKY